MRIRHVVLTTMVLAAMAMLTGCATTVRVNYRTQPDGAQLYAAGRYLGAGAGSVGARISKSQWNAGRHCVMMPAVNARWVSGAEAQEPPRRVCLQAFTGGVVYRDALIARPDDVPGLGMDLDYADQLARQRLAERQTRAVEAAAAAAAAEARARAHDIRLRERRERHRHEHDRYEDDVADSDLGHGYRHDDHADDPGEHDRSPGDHDRGRSDRGGRDHGDQDHGDGDRGDQGHARGDDHGHGKHAARSPRSHRRPPPRATRPIPAPAAKPKPPAQTRKPLHQAVKPPAKAKDVQDGSDTPPPRRNPKRMDPAAAGSGG